MIDGKPGGPPAEVPRLRRVLTLKDLVFYGIVLIQPIAPVGVFGLTLEISRGQAAATIVLAMVAMMCTAFCYGRMAALYPSAGSAYTYVGKGFNPHLGFLAGWAMFLDYLIVPVVSTIYAALTLERLAPAIPYVVWVTFFAGVITVLNLRGIQATAHANVALLAVMSVVIGLFVILSIRFLAGTQGLGGLFSTRPFYNPSSFNIGRVSAATSLAALTYIGFDGVTTLAEDVKNPKRTVLVGTVLVCALTGLFSTVEVYLAQLVWPNYHSFSNIETAFLDVTRRVGGAALFQAMAAVLVIACLGSGLTGQVAAARLLFGMGRDNVLPKKFFGRLHARRNTPVYNIVMLGVLSWAGSMALNYERAAEVLNFGAFLAFMGVNLATLRKYYLEPQPERRRRFWVDACIPCLGFLFCFWIWISLPRPAKLVGGLWLAGGIVYSAAKTRGFRIAPVMIDFTES
jgi:putrescine importer